MGKLKRFCMIVYVAASVLGVGMLATQWYSWEPIASTAAWISGRPWFFALESVLLGATALGLLVILLYALSAPGKNAQLELKRENGTVSITRDAIRSTVRHVIEGHRGMTADRIKVDVLNRRSSPISVHAKVDPGRNAELGQMGAALQDEIAATLEAFSGHKADRVHITFSGDADVVTPAFTQEATKQAAGAGQSPDHTQPLPGRAVE